MDEYVTGDVFLKMPVGTKFREVNLNTNKVFGPVFTKTGDRVADVGDKVIGYYFTYPCGEETSAVMLCAKSCKFKIIKELEAENGP